MIESEWVPDPRLDEPTGEMWATPMGQSMGRFKPNGAHCCAHGCRCGEVAIAEGQANRECLAWCAQRTLLAKLINPATGLDRPADLSDGRCDDECSICDLLPLMALPLSFEQVLGVMAGGNG